MEKYVCTVCGYIYDEAEGCPDAGVAAGTAWADVPDDFVCPLCGVGRTCSKSRRKQLKRKRWCGARGAAPLFYSSFAFC